MARKLPKRLVSAEAKAVVENDPVLDEARLRHSSLNPSSAGGAWARASASVAASELTKLQRERIEKLMSGDLVIELDPSQVTDEIGSDRNADWISDETFDQLKESLAQHGQDVPIQVQVVNPQWKPEFDETTGLNLKDVEFRVIGGRRRLEALKQLGLKVRAVCVPADPSVGFDQLHRRYRENAERENLSLFDELMSIGELFSHEKTFGEKMTGRALAKRLGVSEPKVSKGRALFDNYARISKEIENPHALTLHQLDALIPALRNGTSLPDVDAGKEQASVPLQPSIKKAEMPLRSIKRTQIINGRKIVAKSKGGKISVDLGQTDKCDEHFLDRLLLFIQAEQAK